ncbi:MAG: FAD-dependent oxidoreductase [Planctomycetaceae bacterium]|nr:FAD-dependent oxidoreductase [Planctomycetaceae bacterium]
MRHRELLLLAGLMICSMCTVTHAGDLYYYRQVEPGKPKQIECDVVAYGGTPASFAATLQAARMGKRAILVSSNGFVGGLTSGGLTAVDWGKKHTVGGISKEFFDRARPLTPSVAERTFRKMLSEAGVEVLRDRFLTAVETKKGKLVSITLETGETITAKVFVDGTYEGDLLAAANVSYTVGREPRSAYNESLAGQWQQESWKGVYQFCGLPISPYVKPGDPKSGLLPEISSEPYGEPGDGDYRVQAYNFRMQLTKARDKIAFPKPDGYDASRYALLARFLNFDPQPQWTLHYTVKPMTDGPVQMRNGDSNNAGSFSSDYVGGSHRWPDGTYSPENFSTLPPPRRGLPVPLRKLYELREKIFQDHVTYQQGLMYFLANDKQVPKELQTRVNAWGLSPKEFKGTDHWPHHLYVREGRRMVSDYVMTQDNCQNKRVAEDSVGIASYSMDSHFCQRVVVQEKGVTTVRNEGGLGHRVGPYPVSYRSIVPQKGECSNLLVPLCLSASHIAYGSIRMEPVFMILGQSTGTAACIAIDDDVSVQDVDYIKLRKQLIADKQLL